MFFLSLKVMFLRIFLLLYEKFSFLIFSNDFQGNFKGSYVFCNVVINQEKRCFNEGVCWDECFCVVFNIQLGYVGVYEFNLVYYFSYCC